MRKVEKTTYFCSTCGTAFLKLASQMRAGKSFCNRDCKHKYENPLADRFWAKVSKTDNCWFWVGQISNTGYGRIDGREKPLAAHRISWELHYGLIPENCHVLHRCDNKKCVNPEHLFLGDQRDNNNDKMSKERQGRGVMMPQAKLTDNIVRRLRKRYFNGGVTQQQLADEVGICIGRMNWVLRNKAWRHVQ